MARLYDLRNQIKTRLVAEVADLAAAQVVVARRHGLLEQISQGTAIFTNGVAVTVQAASGSLVDPDNEELVTDSDLIVTLWASPILQDALDEQAEETVFEDILAALHHYTVAVQDTPARTVWQKLKVISWAEVDDPDYLRRDIRIRAELSL